MADNYRFDDLDNEYGIILLFNSFKGKKSYNDNFKKLQDCILFSGRKKSINWYFDVALTSKWIDLWGVEEWDKYIDVICKYCKLSHKIKLLESLKALFFKSKQSKDTSFSEKMLSYISKLKQVINKENEELARKKKIKAVVDTAKKDNLPKNNLDETDDQEPFNM